MSEVTAAQVAGEPLPETPSDPAETPVIPDASDTSEPAPQEIAETDEQKNERELKEQRDRSEKRARGIQKRLDELTADKYAERQRAERAEREREQLLALIQRGNQQPTQAANDEPLRDQFNDYDTYIRAYAKWEARNEARSIVEREFAGERQKVEQQSRRVMQEQEATQLAGHLAKSVDEFRKSTPDYDETVEALDFVPPPDMLRAILDTDNPAKVLHALGKNAAEARRIAGMSPIAIARAIGRIEATLPVPQVSKAPPPGKPVGSKSSASGDPPLDTDAYMAWRKKQMG